MKKESQALRATVFEHIRLLAHASLQSQYERGIPIADVPAELVSGFCDDLFHPKSQTFLDAFTEDEIRHLCVLYGLLYLASKQLNQSDPLKITDLHKLQEWRAVMAYAKELESHL